MSLVDCIRVMIKSVVVNDMGFVHYWGIKTVIEQVFSILNEKNLGYDYIKNIDEFQHIYFYYTYKLNYKKMDYQVILAIEKMKMPEFRNKILLAFLYRFSRKKNINIPRHLLYADKIYFLNKSGELIRNRTLQEELYKITWTHEFLYTAPIKKVSKTRVNNFKHVYDVTKKIQSSVNYPRTKDELKNHIFEMSKTLDKSDISISHSLYQINKIAHKCHNLSHEISHCSSDKKTQELRDKLTILKNQLNNIKKLLEERGEIWPTYESLLNQFIQRKKENERYKYALIQDFISIIYPLNISNTLNIFLKDISKELKNNFIGHKSIQKSIDSYKKELDLLDRYLDNLFNPKIPINKIMKN